jgi:hypothetical protein
MTKSAARKRLQMMGSCIDVFYRRRHMALAAAAALQIVFCEKKTKFVPHQTF